MKKAIVVGATSGIGREVAKVLAQNGYIVGMAGRRMPNLLKLQQEIPTQTYVKQIDVPFISNYLKGLRVNLENRHGKGRIFVTEVLPGWVYTEMTAKADPTQIFWPTTAARAAVQIMEAVNRHQKVIYIARRWRLIAWLIKALPEKWRVKK